YAVRLLAVSRNVTANKPQSLSSFFSSRHATIRPPLTANNPTANSLLLLPLNRRRRLRRDVVDDAVDAADFVDQTAREFRQEIGGKARPVGGHAVDAFDSANGDDVFISAQVAHHAYRLHRQEYGEHLPELVVETGGAHFLVDDCLGVLQDRYPFCR